MASKYVQSSERLVIRPVWGRDVCSMNKQTAKWNLIIEQALKSRRKVVVCIYSSFSLRGGWCVSSKQPHPGNINPRIHLLTTEQEKAGHQCQSRRAWNISPPPGVDSKNDQHVVSHYTAPPTPCERDIISFEVNMFDATITKTCTFTLTKLIRSIVRVFSRRMLAPASVGLTFLNYTFHESHWQMSQMHSLHAKWK
jgi:hypothetical protein